MSESVNFHGYSLEVNNEEKNELQEYITHHDLYKEWMDIETNMGAFHTVLNNVDDFSVFDKHPNLLKELNKLALHRLRVNNQLFQLIKQWDSKRVKQFGFNQYVKEN